MKPSSKKGNLDKHSIFMVVGCMLLVFLGESDGAVLSKGKRRTLLV